MKTLPGRLDGASFWCDGCGGQVPAVEFYTHECPPRRPGHVDRILIAYAAGGILLVWLVACIWIAHAGQGG
jgi:hypothetical protein